MKSKYIVMSIALLALAVCVPSAFAEKWDFTGNYTVPLYFKAVNPCQDVWQEVYSSGGEEHWTYKIRINEDSDGKPVTFDMHIHSNHQGGDGIGYDLVMEGDEPKLDDDGKFIRVLSDPDDPESFVTCDYELPGHWEWTQNFNMGHETVTEVYKCQLISHGKRGNLLIHINRHIIVTFEYDDDGKVISAELSVDHENSNVWCKCAGAQDENGPLDCDADPASCLQPPDPYADAFWRD